MHDALQREIQVLREVATKSAQGIALARNMMPSSSHQLKEEVARIIHRNYNEDRSTEIHEHLGDLKHWLVELESDLFYDLQTYCGDEEKLNRCALAFFPNMTTNACAFPIDNHGYGIALNYGMLFVADRIAHAILLEDDCPDDRAERAYNTAKTLFLAATVEEFDEALRGLIGIGSTELLVTSGAVASLIIRFVALHELGHVCLGHVDQAQMTFNAIEGSVTYGSIASDGVALAELELAADKFAVDRLLKRTTAHEVMWNNALFLCGFFYLLDHIEQQIGRAICPYHPSPRERANAIEDYLKSRIGGPSNDAFSWLKVIFNKWNGGYMSEIAFSVYTRKPDDVLAIFEGDDELVTDGLRIHARGVTRQFGMTTEEVVMNFAISLVSGVPAGLVANYLFLKFAKSGDNTLRFDDKVIKRLDEIEAHISSLSRASPP